jgi:5'-3' exonuclease
LQLLFYHQHSKFQMNDDFEKSIENLSPRAQRVIADLGVKDADSLVGISQDNLERVRGCGKKTITEIETLQKILIDSIKTSQVLNALFGYDDITKDTLEALLGILSKRARNILESLGTNDLKAFMLVNRDQLLECRHCGQKTADEILSIQSGIKTFILDQIDKQGFLQPEELINAPCLAGISVPDHKGDAGDNQEIYADCNNPAKWLYTWINEFSAQIRRLKHLCCKRAWLDHPL